MTGSNTGPGSIEDQAEQLLNEDTESINLVAELDFTYLEESDEYAKWHASSPLEPMVRALFLKHLENYSYQTLHQLLSNNEDYATKLGFEEVPARTTFGRAWRDRFDDSLKQYIKEGAMTVAGIAWQHGNSMGLQALDTEDKSDSSDRTKQRYIAEKTTDVIDQLQRLVYPGFDFTRDPDESKYGSNRFLDLQSHLGLSQSAAESGSKLYADDIGHDNTPDADTHLYNIKRLDPDQVLEMVDRGISVLTSEAKQHLDLDRKVSVAIDMTYVGYYGKRDEVEMVMGAPGGKTYEWCYKFATLTIVRDTTKFTLAMRPVQKGDHIWEVVEDLIQQAKQHLSIGMVYADSEFCSVGTIRILDRENVDYIIPSPKNKRVKREINRMQHDVKVINDYGMWGPVPDGRTMQRGGTNLVLVPSTANPDKTVAFITSEDVSDENAQEREFAEVLLSQYSRRWGIENSYKTIKDFLAWTTSKEYTVRLFYFGFAVLLYDMWLLVDLLVQEALDVERRDKPRVTAKRFLNLARKQLTGIG